MILEAFKNYTPIRHMKVGEEGYGQVGSVYRDENGIHWLNLDGKVSRKYASVLTPHIKRSGPNPDDFDVEVTGIATPFSANSHALRKSHDFICIDGPIYPALQKEQLREVPPISNSPVHPFAQVLGPLYDIFMTPEILNEVLIRTGVPEVIRGEKPVFNGVILFGEGGTGKTALQKAIAKVYENTGAHTAELNVAALSEKYIGSLAHNLDEKIAAIVRKAEKSGKPAFIFLDEATSLVLSAESHNTSGVDYYQEAVDVLKKYISNYPDLVFSITTNAEPDLFDDTLVRDGRLAPIRIPLPGRQELAAMWQFFLIQHGVMGPLSESQYQILADQTPGEKGSFISNFCKGYLPRKKLDLETASAGSNRLLDALAAGQFVSMDQVRKQVTFTELLQDIDAAIESRPQKPKRKAMGFHTSPKKRPVALKQ